MTALTFIEALAERQPKLLEELTIFEISLVEKPANPGAKVAFFKSDDGENAMEMTAIQKDRLALTTLIQSAKTQDELEKLASREHFEDAAEALVAEKRRDGETREACHARLFASGDKTYRSLVEGSLYAKPRYVEAPAQPAAVRKCGAERGLEELARTKAADENIPFAKAYVAVLETPEGRRLYAESRQTKAAAGADPTK